jgi:RES domain
VNLVAWKPAVRIVPSRFPPVDLFERVTNAADREAVMAVESLTNDRLRDERGDSEIVPRDERVGGQGGSVIMAAFTHLNPDGSRFSNGSYGVLYAANDLDTAIAETTYHRQRFMLATSQPSMDLDMMVYLLDVESDFHDIRGQSATLSLIYHKDNYAAGQNLALELRKEGANGIVFDSVRRETGECVAAFRPKALSNCRQERHLCYVWNGKAISTVYEERGLGS